MNNLFNILKDSNGMTDDATVIIARQAKRILELEVALKEAIEVIETWHNMDTGRILSKDDHEITWAIYQSSPEMRRINKALNGDKS